MNPVKTFKVLTGGLSTTLVQTSPPGGGPPPHSHVREDETFFVLEGDYELLQDGVWHKVPAGQAVLAKRGGVHTFRNAGTTTGKMLVFVTPAGMENYLEEISVLTMPQDVEQYPLPSRRRLGRRGGRGSRRWFR